MIYFFMKATLHKVFAVAMVVLLVLNLLYYGMAKIDLFFFWLNLALLGAISYFMYGDKNILRSFGKK